MEALVKSLINRATHPKNQRHGHHAFNQYFSNKLVCFCALIIVDLVKKVNC